MRQKTILLISMIFSWAGFAPGETPCLAFLGDSLTAGYNLSADQAYPALVARKMEDRGLAWRVINSGISGDTTAGGLRRIDWLLRNRIDLLVIALGANDGLRGFNPKEVEANLEAMILKVREKSPSTRIALAGMKLPDNMGADYQDAFAAVFPRVAGRFDIPLLPFLLEGVAGQPDLNLPDGIHPNEAGQRIIADQMWSFIEPLLPPDETHSKQSAAPPQ